MEDTYFSDKVNALKTGVFATLNQKKAELIQRGRKVYNLSVGTPVFNAFTLSEKYVSSIIFSS